ncbi:MAG: heme-binding protein [Burkholderiales bacterium]|nr:heme-binding protein [Burkholderiales bacterium]
MAIEEPKFETVQREAKFEVRQYAPFIVAETWVEGDMDTASNRGFKRIADFIFGNNTTAQGAQSAKVAMTVPVTLEPQSTSTKVAMTAPVALQPEPGGPGMTGAQRWRVHFVMPSQYTMATLPVPNNSAVSLREVPAKKVAVATYSGFNTESRVEEEAQALVAWMQARNFTPAGPPQLARYNPPWTLPVWRRNEIHIEINP